ncbi:hypothetical protein [Actinomadura violacea]|uniref:Uncharacterized protein n=1 Tax=Actinomadura violacea TaxID=2819934 RepID=A0ABS3RZH9_9ACTN|nr:hypothetical protein [Actinomadura violacea]MBO2461708.1 hypothetical protein [Actinomadura violacea]
MAGVDALSGGEPGTCVHRTMNDPGLGPCVFRSYGPGRGVDLHFRPTARRLATTTHSTNTGIPVPLRARRAEDESRGVPAAKAH